MALNPIGKTILEQMGGYGRLNMMLGIQAVNNLPKGVAFMWPNRKRSKGNYVEITLRGDDTYDMEFFNVSIRGKKSVQKFSGIYADQLVELFEKQTGWYLRMGSKRAKEKWIPKDLEEGRCTPGSPNYDCPKGSPQYNLAQTFKKHPEWGEKGGKKGALTKLQPNAPRPGPFLEIAGKPGFWKVMSWQPHKTESDTRVIGEIAWGRIQKVTKAGKPTGKEFYAYFFDKGNKVAVAWKARGRQSTTYKEHRTLPTKGKKGAGMSDDTLRSRRADVETQQWFDTIVGLFERAGIRGQTRCEDDGHTYSCSFLYSPRSGSSGVPQEKLLKAVRRLGVRPQTKSINGFYWSTGQRFQPGFRVVNVKSLEGNVAWTQILAFGPSESRGASLRAQVVHLAGENSEADMSDATLRGKIVRLAHANPEHRDVLLGLLRREAGVLDKLFKRYKKDHPESKRPPKSLVEEAKKIEEGKKDKPEKKPEPKKEKKPEPEKPKGEGKKDKPKAEKKPEPKKKMSPEEKEKQHKEWLDSYMKSYQQAEQEGWLEGQQRSAGALRGKVVRLAHTNPKLRPVLLAALREAGELPEAFKKNIEKMKAKSKGKKDENKGGDKKDDSGSEKPWEKGKKKAKSKHPIPKAYYEYIGGDALKIRDAIDAGKPVPAAAKRSVKKLLEDTLAKQKAGKATVDRTVLKHYKSLLKFLQ